MNLADVIKEFINKQLAKQEIYSIVCEVESIDLGARTCVCTPVNGGAELKDVRFQVELNSAVGLFIEPAANSKVIVSFLSPEISYISLYSEIENVYLDANDKITFNGGASGAMVKIGDLTTKLNTLVSELQAQLALIQTGITAGGGAYTPGTLSTFNQNDYDNPNILQ